MKQNAFLMVVLAMMVFATSCEKEGIAREYTMCEAGQIIAAGERVNETTLNLTEITAQIREYITTEFAGYSIQSASSYQDAANSEYIELVMNNNGVLLFTGQGSFICGDDSFLYGEEEDYIAIEDLPQAITDYIAANYPNDTIDKASFEDNEYEVELTSGTELYFDENGNFLKEG